MAGKGAIIIAGQSQAASSTETNIEVTAASNRLCKVDRTIVSQSTHKTSEQYEVQWQRVTTTGTGTAYTPLLDEPNSGAVGFTVEVDSSVEPTYTASTVLLDVHWNSLTGKDIPAALFGSELWIAPSALLGSKIITPSGTTTFTPRHYAHLTELG